MLLILDPDAPDELVEALLRDVQELGWTGEVSRGEEQVVIALAGKGDAAQLEQRLAARPEVDVVPLLARGQYAALRARRKFMTGMASGLGVLTAIGAGVPVVGFLMPPKGSLADRELAFAGKHGELEVRGGKRLLVFGKPVFLVRFDEQRYYAASAVCTHMNVCQLEWSVERHQLVCPCHGGAFDVFGNVVQGPPSIPLVTYDVRRIGEELYIQRRG